MVNIKYQSRSIQKDGSTTRTDLTFYGSFDELTALEAEAYRDTLFGLQYAVEGSVMGSTLSQADGDIWELKVSFTSDAVDVTLIDNPESTEFGKFSASMSSSTMSMPLETHRRYRTHWNHYLCAATTTAGPYTGSLPDWYLTATGLTDNMKMGAGDVYFKWVRDPSELQTTEEINGTIYYWYVIKDPYIPNSAGVKFRTVDSYDEVFYTVTESAKFRTAEEAGKYAENVLNQIGAPRNQFNLTWGNWKCDAVSVQWNGKWWKMQLTWTHSGDYLGWNDTLYDYGGDE